MEGLGLIPLPLTDRDAKAIISRSAQAPYGHREITAVNTKVRDTWQIEPAKITFQNAAWDVFVRDTVVPSVSQTLNGTAFRTPPRCELYKLLLYETGSQFVPCSYPLNRNVLPITFFFSSSFLPHQE